MEKLLEMGVVDQDGNAIHDISRGLKTIPQGAATTVWCATNPILEGKGGVYCEDNNIAALHTSEQDVSNSVNRTRFNGQGVMAYAIDETNAEKLWTLSEQLTNTSFNL